MASGDRLALLIPAYNAAGFLPRLLETAAAQSAPFDEIWVYDDCSTDDTAAVAEHLGARVVRGEANRGCSHGKNVLARRTECEWIHFHDADDLLLPHFVEKAHSWIARSEFDVIAFGCEERDADTGRIISVSRPVHEALLADPIGYCLRNKINSISGVYRRNAFIAAGGYDEDPLVLYNEDQAMHSQLARANLRFAGEATVGVVNLKRTQSMSTANEAKCLLAHFHVVMKTLPACASLDQKAAAAERLWHVASGAASFLDWETADLAADQATRLAGTGAVPSGRLFRTLCSLSPRLALRLREGLIRLVRPHLRQGFPQTSAIGAFGMASRS